MKKLKIAIDVDDVLSSHASEFVIFSNEKYGTHLTIEDYDDQWSKLWHVDRDEIERRAEEFHTPEGALARELIVKADHAIGTLARHHALYVVTAREKELMKPTFAWLDQYFAGLFEGVHFVPIWEPDNKVTKADICNKIGAEYLIDDVVSHCNIAAQTGIKALLFGNYAWNRHKPIESGVKRVADWDEVLEYFGHA